jgi:hypothetical protein
MTKLVISGQVTTNTGHLQRPVRILLVSANRQSVAFLVDFEGVLEQEILDGSGAVVVNQALFCRESVLKVRADVITLRVIDLGG